MEGMRLTCKISDKRMQCGVKILWAQSEGLFKFMFVFGKIYNLKRLMFK